MARDKAEDESGNEMLLNRRGLLKSAGAAVALGTVGLLGKRVGAQSGEAITSADGSVTVPPGEYTWDGDGFDVSGSLVGGGDPGDVVYNLEGGSMDGSVSGRVENIVVRGSNPESKAGVNLEPGCTVDGFIWPEGGQEDEDRAFYTPDGGDDRVTLRNSAWAFMSNNGAYLDKPPVLIENCASVNNNIAGIRVGHRDGTSGGLTSYVRNTLIAATAEIPYDSTNSGNARGLRVRHPGTIVIENCYFLYLDVEGSGNLIEIEDEAAGSDVIIRNCTFYNESGGSIVADDSGGSVNITMEGCVAAGGGSYDVEGVDDPGLTEVDDVTIPSPGAITGYSVANQIESVRPGVGPWTEADFDGDYEPAPPSEEPVEDAAEPAPEYDSSIVLHASPDNAGDVDVSFTVDGAVGFGDEAEADSDTIEENGDGTVTATSVGLDPDALDSYLFSGSVVDYDVPSGAVVDVSVDGSTTTFADLTGQPASDDSGSESGSSGSDDGSDDGSGGGSGGSTDDSASSGDSGSNDTASSRKVVRVDGSNSESMTEYTFTVSGDVVRDPELSSVSSDAPAWDQIEDIAKDGKVIGLVGEGVDVYRYDGTIQQLTVRGDADVTFERADA